MTLSLRRHRLNPVLRDSLRDFRWNPAQLIAPIFIDESLSRPEALSGLVGHDRHTIDSASTYVERLREKKIKQFILFGVPAEKHAHADQTIQPNGIVANSLQAFRKRFGDEAFFWTDLCLCSFTDTGACGFLHEKGFVDNESTVEHLARSAVVYAQAGAHGIAPSDMMDGRVGAIRKALDGAKLNDIPIMSYAAKFASHFYGPFRDAAKSSPQKANPKPSLESPRANYQIDPPARTDAIQSALRDVEEGADIIMVKPGLPYLDILRELNDRGVGPLAVYQVSGEYAALMGLVNQGFANAYGIFNETMTSFRRAGAQLLITYASELLVDNSPR